MRRVFGVDVRLLSAWLLCDGGSGRDGGGCLRGATFPRLRSSACTGRSPVACYSPPLPVGPYCCASSMVLGVEADVSAGDYVFNSGPLAESNVFVAGDTLNGSFEGGFDAFGTIRARAGLLVSPRTLLYATGGLALARAKSSITLTYDDGSGPIAARFSDDNIEWGYALGGGIEDKFADALSVKLEYLFIGINDASFEFSQLGVTVGYDAKVYLNLVRLGLNYGF